MTSDRIPSAPPPIPALSESAQRPLWSVMIPTYNCSNYLKDTIQSVLAANIPEALMQIEVIDDCSTDADVQALVQQAGAGRVAFFGQENNVGSLRNFETCIKRAKGHWVHILHGDDLVLPGFYKEIEGLFRSNLSIGAAFTGFSAIDENGKFLYNNNKVQNNAGIIADWLLTIAKNQCLRTCAIVVKRDVYEEIGGFYGVHYGEDWEMFVRIASKFAVAYSPENLAKYRLHNNNISTRYLATGQNIRDIKKVINIIQGYLPAEKREEIKESSRKNFSVYFTGHAQGIYREHRNAKIALTQAKGALSLHFNKRTLTSLLKLYLKTFLNYSGKK
jgi:glycosyltransferase involved in cell wall biosynthesis